MLVIKNSESYHFSSPSSFPVIDEKRTYYKAFERLHYLYGVEKDTLFKARERVLMVIILIETSLVCVFKNEV